KLRGISRNDVDRTTRQIACVEKLVQITSNQRIALRRNSNRGVSHRNHRHCQRYEAKQRSIRRTNDADSSDRLIHRERHVAKWGVVHCTFKLVRPCRIRKYSLDTLAD